MFLYINALLSIGLENRMTGYIALENKAGDWLNIHSLNWTQCFTNRMPTNDVLQTRMKRENLHDEFLAINCDRVSFKVLHVILHKVI